MIDVHAHLFGERSWAPDWFWRGYVGVLSRNLSRPVDEVEAEVLPSMWDPSGDRLVAEMDAAGVTRCVLLPLDWELAADAPGPAHTIGELHERYAAIVAAHPERLVLGAGIDPRRPDAVDLLRHAVRGLGARVLKLYPPAGFYPNDPQVYPLYAACVDLGIPVLLHSGPAIAPFRSRFSHPIHLDDVAADFPGLTIVAGHAGHGWWMDALAVARSKFNIFLEVSGWALLAAHPERIYAPLRQLLDVLPGRVMFGSDHIGLPGALARTASLFRSLPEAALPYGIRFEPAETRDLLAGTALRAFDLTPSGATRPTGR